MLRSDTCDIVWILLTSVNNISPSEVDLFEENLLKTQVFTQKDTYTHTHTHTLVHTLPLRQRDRLVVTFDPVRIITIL